MGATPTRRHDEVQGAATARSGQEEGSRSRRLQHGDGSFVGEPAPKRQKTAEAEGQSSSQAPPPPPQCPQPQATTSAAMPTAAGEAGGGAAVFSGATDSTTAANNVAPSDAATTTITRAACPVPAAESALAGGRYQTTGESSTGKKDPPITQGGWVWPDFK
jgi:hypothetical protein